MRTWKPKFGIGLVVALLLLLAVLAAAGWFGLRLWQVVQPPPDQWQLTLTTYRDLVSFLALCILAGTVAYRLAAALTLNYQMDRNGLYLVWMGNRSVIPLSQIATIDTGMQGAGIPLHPLRMVGYYWGQGRTAQGKPLHLFTTVRPRNSLIIHTSSAAYAISPANQDAFVQELEQRRRIGAVKELRPTVEPGRLLFYAFWKDRVVQWAIIAACVLNLALLGWLAAVYGDLAPMLPMRFDAAGVVSGYRPRHQILFLPLAAFGLALLNTALGLAVYRREPLSARLLQIGAIGVQVVFGVAVLAILLR